MRRTIALTAMTALMMSAGCSTSDRAAPIVPSPQLPPPNAGIEPGLVGAPGPGLMPGAAPAAGACNAAAAQFLVGQIANVEASDQAKAATGAEEIRVLYPNQPVTQEFVPTRLNLDTDNRNRITAVRCG